MSIAV